VKANIRSFVVCSTILVLGAAFARPASSPVRHDSQIPVIVAPSPSTIEMGGSSTVTVTLSGTVTSNTTVNLSSNLTELTVPSTVTVPSGSSSVQFTAQSSSGAPRLKGSYEATITASCNGGNAYGTITILTSGKS
jgi:hypothetical protein